MRILIAFLIPVVGLFASAAQAAERAFVIPAPALDETAHADKQTVVLAGGCFWGVQAVFQHTKGVTSAVSVRRRAPDRRDRWARCRATDAAASRSGSPVRWICWREAALRRRPRRNQCEPSMGARSERCAGSPSRVFFRLICILSVI